jgi:hypothetical protein
VDDRLVSYLAQGGEILVSTEHDVLYDHTPNIRRLGLENRLAYVIGVEITSAYESDVLPDTIGHANAFPLVSQPYAHRRGAPANENIRWRDVIAELRKSPANPVIQLNHPRFVREPGKDPSAEEEEEIFDPQAFFSHMGPASERFDPHQPLSAGANAVLVEPDPTTGIRDIDFDAIELLNGPYYASYRKARDDWFSLLRQGERLAGTANSDSHRLTTTEVVLSPRNMVYMGSDTIGDFDADRFVTAVREGRLYGTTGPLFTSVQVDKAGIGDIHHGEKGTLSVVVEAPEWVNIDRIRVFDNGIKVHEDTIQASTAFELPMHFEQDSFVVIEVEGQAGKEFARILPGHIPFAFTNPIYVDADGDGAWTPIGTPLP